MPSYLAALETQWLTTDFHHLLQLVDGATLSATRRECGFDQAVQRKLRTFDASRAIGARASLLRAAALAAP
ncbi:hypothetical protein E4U41_002488, partial [Claviceps citrina]